MTSSSVQNPIAERTLVMDGRDVLVVIGRPQQVGNGSDFRCRYSIRYMEHERVSHAYGLDAVQALQLAMKKIGADLTYLAQTENKTISWLSDTPGDTGFPI